MKKYIKWVIAILIIVVLLFSINQKQKQIASLKNQTEQYSKQITQLKKADISESAEANVRFMDAFYNYEDANNRLENVEQITTDDGFQACFPSGIKESEKVISSYSNLTAYEHIIDKKTVSYINQFDFRINANGLTKTIHATIRISLTNFGDNDWKVDDVDMIQMLSVEP
ncbi:hypothetical protein AB0308_001238 [Listeria monocytogenes]|nr:hypothetical protein [Listeria monocytogenes]EEJ0016246.1 hypothetical protein [Listeria innocua]EEJ1215282.1 hypothetical protein [Listeria innocua]HBN5100599.1 hypothetical protein [Listeria innocua]HBN5103491.1 hypothetical protein [Listeria innocua]